MMGDESTSTSTSSPSFYYHGGIESKLKININIKNGSEIKAIEFPCKTKQLKEIVTNDCTLAPFGKGEKTITDTTVRNVWQINKELEIGGKGRIKNTCSKVWTDTMNEIIENCKKGLGIDSNEKVEANFYKCLIYEKDTEKEDRMFATLVLSLPSNHTGGELIISHGDKTVDINLENNSMSSKFINYCAFYSDCKHEVKPVKHGYRICLIYNLIKTNKRSIDEEDVSNNNNKRVKRTTTENTENNELNENEKLIKNEIIKKLTERGQASKLIYVLEHEYTKAQRLFTDLKGKDQGIGKTLLTIANSKESNIVVFLAQLEIEENAYGEYELRNWKEELFNNDHSDYDDDDSDLNSDDEQDDEFDLYEQDYVEEYVEIEFTSKQSISNFVDSNNKKINIENMMMEKGYIEILPSSSLDNIEPYKVKESGPTGNEGATQDRQYRTTVFVICKKDELLKVFNKYSKDPFKKIPPTKSIEWANKFLKQN